MFSTDWINQSDSAFLVHRTYSGDLADVRVNCLISGNFGFSFFAQGHLNPIAKWPAWPTSSLLCSCLPSQAQQSSSLSFVWAPRRSMRRRELHFSGLSRRLVLWGCSRAGWNKTDCSLRCGMVWNWLQMISLYNRWGRVLAWLVSSCVSYNRETAANLGDVSARVLRACWNRRGSIGAYLESLVLAGNMKVLM